MKKITLLFLFLLSAVVVELQAQATLSFQGVVKNTNETSVDNGKYEFIFQLYEDATGGVPIWSETQTNVVVSGGIYSVVLGAVTPLDVPFDTSYYLGVSFDGGAELTPRTQLTAAPYALSLLGNSNVFPSDGNVGIGTTDPLAALHVAGGVNMDGDVGIGTTTPDKKLHVVGDVQIDGDLVVSGNLPPAPVPDTVIVANESNLRMIRGSIKADGTIVYGSGFTVTKGGSGYYTMHFDTPFASQPFFVGTIHASGYVRGFVEPHSINPHEVFYSTGSVNAPLANLDHVFIVIGPD